MKRLGVLLGCMLLAACGPKVPALKPQPAPAELATPDAAERVTAVAVSDACRRFTTQTAHPNVVGLNAKVAWKLADHALSVANGKAIKADDCIRQQADEYARGLAR